MMLSLVFLWLGNIALADCDLGAIQTYLNCPQWQSCTLPPASSYSTCTQSNCPSCAKWDWTICDITKCPNLSNSAWGAWIDCGDGTICPCNSDCDELEPGVYACKEVSQCPVGGVIDTEDDNSPVVEVMCQKKWSDLYNDMNSKQTTIWTCECKKTYGEYYNTSWPKAWKYSCELCTRDDVCCGTKLNTKIPFIGNCIESSSQASGSVINETTAFPILISALVKIIISVILIASFILIIVAGVRWSAGDAKWGKDMIIKVAVWLAILWASGVILRLINPNFFG